MAPKNLDKVAAIKVKAKAPKTTPPVDPWDQAFNDALNTATTTTTTTTTVPTTPTTVPKTTSGTSGGRKPIETSAEAAKLLAAQQKRAANLKVTPVETAKVQEDKKPKGISGFLSKVVNFDIIPGGAEFKPAKSALIPAIGVATTFGRGILAAGEEGIDTVRQLTGKAQKYERGDYIPIHKQTGLPIAKPGDFVIRNWADLVNVPVNIPKNATPEQKAQATTDLVKSKGRTTAGSAKDLLKAAQDFSYSASDNPYVPSTGNPIIDGVIDFGYDVLLDPVTYATFGGSAVVTAAKGGVKAAAKGAARQTARVAAAEAAETAARVAADVTASAAQKAAAKAAAEAAEAAAEKAFKQAAAAAPRRQYGRGAREALADQVRTIRQSAQTVVDDVAASTAEKAVAQQAIGVLTDDFIKDVAAKGYSVIRGEAAKTLGVRSGARIGLPGFGKSTIPYTAGLTEFVGSALVKPRYAFFQSQAGQKVLNSITAVGEGGLFGSEQILKMRTALRAGTATPQEAVDYSALLSADKFYRGAVDLARKKGAVEVGKVTNGKNAQTIRELSEHLATPEGQWASKSLRPLTASEREVFDSVKNVLNNFYKEADSAAALLGAKQLPALVDYWPRSQSTQAVEWAARNGDEADRIATGLGVDRTFFLGNFTSRALGPGKVWFGEVLDGTESIFDLNRIAREQGGLKFDFFETDPVKALAGYANTHAKYIGYATALDRITKISPSKTKGFAQQLTGPALLVPARKPGVTNLGSLENSIANFMTPERLTKWSEAQILAVRDSINDLQSKLAGSSDIVKSEFDDAITEIDEKIISITRLINAKKIDPDAGSLLKAELETYADNLALSISNTKRDFLVTDKDRWKNVGRTLEDGFVVLNTKTVPDIAVRADIAEIFQNVKRLDDPAFVKQAEKYLLDYNNFFKSAVTTTLGFHIRNGLSNAFMLLAAGANPINLTRGLRIYKEWRKFAKNYESELVTTATGKLTIPFVPPVARTKAIPDEVISKFIKNRLDRGLIKPGEEAAVREALAYSGATGFGQFGEIAAASGAGKVGVLGKEATGRIPFTGKEFIGLKKASLVAGAPFRGSRKLGTLIEDFNRFQLTYDGLMQGYDAATAAARTGKFLVDYNDISTADRALKQIQPFWLWASRNLPLQIENMWLNPKAYTIYDKFKNNLEDKEGTSPYLPDYLKAAGAFKLPFGNDLYLKPDLGFPGAGNPNQLQQIASGDASQLLSGLTPGLRALIEARRTNPEAADTDSIQESGRQFFGDIPIPKDISPFEYIIAQGIPGLSTIGRVLSILPGTEPKQVQELTGSKPDSELQATLGFVGSPAFKLLDKSQKGEIWRRYFLLKEYLDSVVDKNREERRRK
jgi:hypothetical protein